MSNCYICEEEAEISEMYFGKQLVECKSCKSYYLAENAVLDMKAGKYQIDIEKFRQYVGASSEPGEYPVIDSHILQTFRV